MTRLGFVFRSLLHYRRRHLAVVASTAVATAALTGSLLVGDSVDGSLRELEQLRTGKAAAFLRTPGRFFRAALADEIAADLQVTVAPVLELPSVAGREDADESLPGVRLLGVDERFFALGTRPLEPPAEEHVALSQALAQALHVKAGETIIIRAEKPSAIPGDLPLAVDTDLPLRLTVDRVVGPDEMGRFELRANPEAPLLAFVARDWLAEKAAIAHRANTLLVAEGSTLEAAQSSMRKHFRLADANAQLRPVGDGTVELRSDRIFLDAPLDRAAAALGGKGILAWFVKGIRGGSGVTPYSMVAGTDTIGQLKPGEVAINAWLAEDLGLHPGDRIELDYDVFGLARKMEGRTASFTVQAVLPIEGPTADPTLMPSVPGLSDVANCRDWDPGFPLDTGQLRPKDEQYWNEHRGTPKVFLTLSEAESLFASRYGTHTAFRFPDQPNLESRLISAIDPAALGFAFAPVRRLNTAVDFGPLFEGFSFVLVISALLLTALLFSFGVEERSREIGTLRGVGFRSRDIRWLLISEAALLALAGALVGVPMGLVYTEGALAGLSSVWREAAGLPALALHVSTGTLWLGGALGAVASLAGLLYVLRGQLRGQTQTLLAGKVRRPDGRRSRTVALVLVTVAVLIVLAFGRRTGAEAAEVFFGAGALFLIAGFFGADAFLLWVSRSKGQARTFATLALSAAVRRRRRSITTIALISSGAFLVVGVGGGRSNPRADTDRRASGTGGFALVGESARPIARDLNSPAVRPQIGIDPSLPASFVSLRVHEGDDASCRSPGRPAAPRLYGVPPKELTDRSPFTFSAGGPWAKLEEALPDGAVPAIGDEGTVVWSLHLGLGDTLQLTNESGQPLRLRIVGITATSILQGGLAISEAQFLAHFPGDGGYRLFLIDSAAAEAPAVSRALTEALKDSGLRVQPAWQRLASSQSVENTYLAIFQTLGALGLLFGCLGIAVLVLRHALERRAELAVLEVVGFTRPQVRWLFVYEHAVLVMMGLANGVCAAIICLVPMLRSPGTPIPYGSLAADLLAITLTGLLAAGGATWLALRGTLAGSLQSET